MQVTATPSVAPLTGMSSMATRQLLAELTQAYAERGGQTVLIESVGGVDAAKRVQAGEVFDLVVLASDAMAKLMAAGHLRTESLTPLVHSGVAVAVRAGTPAPDISSEDALRQAVLAAPTLSYSTGPSGVALANVRDRLGLLHDVQGQFQCGLKDGLFQVRIEVPA